MYPGWVEKEPAERLKKVRFPEPYLLRGKLRAWDSVNYKATVAIVGADAALIEDIPTSQSIVSADMVRGRYVAIMAFDTNPKDWCVVAVWGAPAVGLDYYEAKIIADYFDVPNAQTSLGLEVSVTLGDHDFALVMGQARFDSDTADEDLTLFLVRDTTILDKATFEVGAGTGEVTLSFYYVDAPGAATYIYKLEAQSSLATGDIIASASQPAKITVIVFRK